VTGSTIQTRTYTLSIEETADWLADADGDDHAFTKRSLTTNERPGTRIEIYSCEGRLLEAFPVIAS
jgi:hypothetical protein